MTFKYSICHPDKEEIEYKNDLISSSEVLKLAKNYSWIEILNSMDNTNQNEIFYSPSLDFTCIETKHSFCLTADLSEKNNLEFSLWYNRPKKVKILFGLLGEKEQMVVDEFWSLDIENSLKYLEHFINGNYKIVEELYKK